MRRAFTLSEVLVVVAVTATLMGILLPVTGRARLQAKVLAVNAELRDIGLALEAYSFDHDSRYPPTRVDCMLGEHYYQLPYELTQAGYLPAPPPDTFLSTGIEDRFNRGYTYKYRSVGTLIYNRTYVVDKGAYLWVPDGFTDHEQKEGQTYSDPKTSPVSWVLYSQGPNFDDARMRKLNYPVPRATWFDPQTGRGVITRLRLRNGNQIGSFER
ncbi:MAG TPA: prepilin-type N-terminal cleavage/methylation domain-containing protein [Sedimentisphaerales bacterium]|nr:prepilin-type N-terminal cleavage/methylation domain-containing protein [Sedimentisphaerales bacterium]HRS10717.1 prepilin-type N-terminal cleavage/methylation domain-containing protein [Sedimentisphaerales bacterium]HRV47422.1 prepilin-type N-terminal cleavage/methylation domain-containing protein [Sedimentisphaerales bacterium]